MVAFYCLMGRTFAVPKDKYAAGISAHSLSQQDTMLYTFLFFIVFSLPCCSILVGNFPRIQIVQWDYLNPTLGSPKGPFLEFRSPGRWDYAICRTLHMLSHLKNRTQQNFTITNFGHPVSKSWLKTLMGLVASWTP